MWALIQYSTVPFASHYCYLLFSSFSLQGSYNTKKTVDLFMRNLLLSRAPPSEIRETHKNHVYNVICVVLSQIIFFIFRNFFTLPTVFFQFISHCIAFHYFSLSFRTFRLGPFYKKEKKNTN